MNYGSFRKSSVAFLFFAVYFIASASAQTSLAMCKVTVRLIEVSPANVNAGKGKTSSSPSLANVRGDVSDDDLIKSLSRVDPESDFRLLSSVTTATLKDQDLPVKLDLGSTKLDLVARVSSLHKDNLIPISVTASLETPVYSSNRRNLPAIDRGMKTAKNLLKSGEVYLVLGSLRAMHGSTSSPLGRRTSVILLLTVLE